MAADTDCVDNEEFYKNLLLSLEKDGQNLPSTTNDDGKFILPKPGFVIKTKNEAGEKIFMNILASSELPPPKDISDAELQQLLEDPDATQFKVPLALGDPHAETDKSGKGCTVYDVVINDSYLSKIQKNNFLMGFFMTVVFEGIESKYSLTLSRDWIMLKNKKCIGDINRHKIRNRSKPVIQEMNQTSDIGLNEDDRKKTENGKDKIIKIISNLADLLTGEDKIQRSDRVSTRTSNDGCPKLLSISGNVSVVIQVSTRHLPSKIERDPTCEPSYKMLLEPPSGAPDYLITEIALPGVKSMGNTVLDVGDDRLILNVPEKNYHLDLIFPHLVDYESGGAQFNRKTKILTVTIPVKKPSQE